MLLTKNILCPEKVLSSTMQAWIKEGEEKRVTGSCFVLNIKKSVLPKLNFLVTIIFLEIENGISQNLDF